MFWVYILRCADGSYYTGHTDNLEKRIGEHQTGARGGYTAERLPVELAWSQACATREEALSAELQIKGWSRKKKEAMMRGDWREVNRLGRGKHQHQRNPSTSTPAASQPTLHASTPAASQPTLSTNGGDADPIDMPSICPERSAEPNPVHPECSAATHPVHPERSAAHHSVRPERSAVSHSVRPERSAVSHSVHPERSAEGAESKGHATGIDKE